MTRKPYLSDRLSKKLGRLQRLHGPRLSRAVGAVLVVSLSLVGWTPTAASVLPQRGPILIEGDSGFCIPDGAGGWVDTGVTNCDTADGSLGAPYEIDGWDMSNVAFTPKQLAGRCTTPLGDQTFGSGALTITNVSRHFTISNISLGNRGIVVSNSTEDVPLLGIASSGVPALYVDAASVLVRNSSLGYVEFDNASFVASHIDLGGAFSRCAAGVHIDNSTIGSVDVVQFQTRGCQNENDSATFLIENSIVGGSLRAFDDVDGVNYPCLVALRGNMVEGGYAGSVVGAVRDVTVVANRFVRNGYESGNGCSFALTLARPSIGIAVINVTGNTFAGNCAGLRLVSPPVGLRGPLGPPDMSTAGYNWWNSTAGPTLSLPFLTIGPGGDSYQGTLPFAPWCTNPECTSFGPP